MNNAVGLIKLLLSEIDNDAKANLISVISERKQLFYDLDAYRKEVIQKEIDLFVNNIGIKKEEKEQNILKRISSSVDDVFELADKIIRAEQQKNKYKSVRKQNI